MNTTPHLRFSLCVALFAFTASGCFTDYIDTYEECAVASDCDNRNDYCQGYASSTVRTNICTRECWDSADCPVTDDGLEPACLVNGPGEYGVCVETCNFHTDCEPGFDCEPAPDGSFVNICVPR